MTRVAAVIVSYFSAEKLQPLLPTLRSTRADVSTWIVDNSMDEAELDLLRAITLPHRTIASPRNLGYGGAVNLAVQAMRSEEHLPDWILVCNPDLELEPDALDELLAAAEQHPAAAILGPRIRDAEGAVYPSARTFPHLVNGAGHALLFRAWPSNPFSRTYHQRVASLAEVPTRADWLSGACLLVRAEVFDAVGGFDEAFFMYFEDVDLSRRVADLGYDRLFVPSAVAIHEGAHSTSRHATLMSRVHHQSAYLYLAKQYPGWRNAPLRLVLRTALYLRGRITR